MTKETMTEEAITEEAMTNQAAGKRNVIIDCDPGIDDSLAIMLALSMEELNVEALTIVCGNCPVEMGFSNAKKVLKQMGRLDIPVYVGADRPLVREYVNALDTHGADGLGESFLPDVPGYEQGMSAVEFLAQRFGGTCAGTVSGQDGQEDIRQAGDYQPPCSIIALGPMTNLAQLIQKDPQAFARIEEIVSMGGNFRSHGNCSPVAEYNYWVDPDAAALVYETTAQIGRKISMIGLDVTRQIVLTPNLLEYMKRLKPETGRFVQAITKFYFDFHWEWEHLIGCVINDPLAVAYFADRTLCSGLEAYTAVETGGISMGQTVVDSMNFYRREPNALVLTETDPVRFFQLLFGSVLDMEEQELDLIEALVEPNTQLGSIVQAGTDGQQRACGRTRS